jgi:hypothetical protein
VKRRDVVKHSLFVCETSSCVVFGGRLEALAVRASSEKRKFKMSDSGTQDATNTDDVVPPPAAIKSPVNKAMEKVGGVAGTIASSIFDGASAVVSLVAGSSSKAEAGDCKAEQTSPEVWGASGNIAKGTNTGDISGDSDGGRARLSADISDSVYVYCSVTNAQTKKRILSFIVVCFCT